MGTWPQEEHQRGAAGTFLKSPAITVFRQGYAWIWVGIAAIIATDLLGQRASGADLAWPRWR